MRTSRRVPISPRRLSRIAAGLLVLLLAGAARGEGAPRLRVLVELEMDALPEGHLGSPDRVQRQRMGIRWARDGLASEMAGRDFAVTRAFESVPYVAAELSMDAMRALAESPWVRSLSGDDVLRPTLAESTALVQAPQVWPDGFDGTGFAVAVLDTGVDGTHPHLSGKVVEEACFSSTGSCPNGSDRQTGAGAGRPCTYSNTCDHGTHVAGIAAGASTTLSGVAPGAEVIAIQVFSQFDDAPYCSPGESCPIAQTSDMIEALEHVYQLRDRFDIAAVNMSLGGGLYTSESECDLFNGAVKAAIDNLRSVGIATIAASGNDGALGAINSPGCISSAVSVGSITKSGDVSYFSNAARFLSLMAPGSGILSSVPGGGFATMSGTSMATPHVAGAWAILRQVDPTASVDTVLSRIRKNGLKVPDPAAGITKKLAQLRAAVDASVVETSEGLRVKSLNRRKKLKANQVVTLKWEATAGLQRFDVAITLDGGDTWIPIVSDFEGTEFVWTVPQLEWSVGQAKLRVEGYDAEGNRTAVDRSDRFFRIKGLRKRSPIAGAG